MYQKLMLWGWINEIKIDIPRLSVLRSETATLEVSIIKDNWTATLVGSRKMSICGTL